MSFGKRQHVEPRPPRACSRARIGRPPCCTWPLYYRGHAARRDHGSAGRQHRFHVPRSLKARSARSRGGAAQAASGRREPRKRLNDFPSVPTIAECPAIRAFEMVAWVGRLRAGEDAERESSRGSMPSMNRILGASRHARLFRITIRRCAGLCHDSGGLARLTSARDTKALGRDRRASPRSKKKGRAK